MYTPVINHLFSRSTALLNQLGLSITDARIITSKRNYAVNTFIILDSSGEPVFDHYQGQELITLMQQELTNPNDESPHVSQTTARRIRHFRVSTRIRFQQDDAGQRTILELITTDSPGLLSRIGQVFHSMDIQLHNAKVATFGAQVEDVFYITGADDEPLSESAQQDLRDQLTKTLDEA
jgi:[protein-PII] uridylyltransferase